ncbi:parallel beta-helix, partial [Bacillus thuringiensis]|nr:parallel beta-helix [Bacillus thuringiensis]
ISIQNLKIEQCNDRADQPAVLVTGNNHSINEIEVYASYMGMKLENARNITIENSTIIGQKKANGIDLWQSDNNLIKNTKIK